MDTKQFLTRVFAHVDDLLIFTHKPDPSGVRKEGFGWNRGSFSDLDEAVENILLWDADPLTTVYFTIGAMANHGYIDDRGKQKWHRRQENATWFKTLALDLDIGPDKPYATQGEGWKAMHAALQNIGMPNPMVISSGNGIHLYWPLTEAINRDTWVKTSKALRMALEEQKVIIDTTKIHDPSMVLRPVGTHHKKQTPWKPVTLKLDCPDYAFADLQQVLSKWERALPATPSRSRSRTGKKSSILDAVLVSNDVDIDAVGERCAQVAALIASGGVTDAAGMAVEEPMWRLSLGLAKYATDPEQAIIKMAGKHPEFNLDANLQKLEGWKGTGPTTCAALENLCSKGCLECPRKGQITSPAQLSVATETTVETPAGEEVVFTLPPSYVVKDGRVYKEVKVETTGTDANGNEVASEHIEHDIVSNYEMHITGVFYDVKTKQSAFKLLIKFPMVGWKEQAHDITVLSAAGKDFSGFLLNRQVYVKNIGQQDKLRGFLMDYLTMVQQQTPSGQDYTDFGWQKDDSFLCGERVLGAPLGATDSRLRGPASQYGAYIGPMGERSEWVRAMKMLDQPGTLTVRSAILLSTTGILGTASGNAQLVVSIYSQETTTGKTLSLIAANSLIGAPKQLLLNKNDTANALYALRGMLNHLPACLDEYTTATESEADTLVYDLSQGREKTRMNKDGTLREPRTWGGPTLITGNEPMHDKLSGAREGSEPTKVRCLEFAQHDRRFVTPKEGQVRSDAYVFFDLLLKNNGFAFPELVEKVLELGGARAVWDAAESKFEEVFKFQFEPQERFYRTGIISAWAIGRIGASLGLFPFDIRETIEYMLDTIKAYRVAHKNDKSDVFDTIGQYLAAHNDMIVECRERYGSGVEQVVMPAPERAVARVKIVYDEKNAVLPGSYIALIIEPLRKQLKLRNDTVDRLVRELEDDKALINRSERITVFKGCPRHAPGQARCLILNLAHPRFAETLTGVTARAQSKVALAVLGGGAAA